MDADRTVSTHTYVAPARSDSTPLVFGSTVGRFVVRERLGIGGMGEVYRAEDTQLKRTVAIKRLVHDVPDRSPLLKEAQRASALNHPCIASVYDVFTLGNELLLVMEYVDGVTLRDRMRREFSVGDFCAIATQCTEALAAAHRNGILHGDLKPANIMLTRDGQVKVCDFGLARRLPSSDGVAETTTTAPHVIAGTPAYMAPETILDRPTDQRADIFSLGVVFYQMLALHNPFIDDGPMATLDRILHHTPEPLDRVNPQVPGKLARTVQRMLEKEPHDRYASAAEIGQVVSEIGAQYVASQRRRHLVRRVKTWSAAAAVALLLVLTVPRLANRPSADVPLPQPVHLAILPFTAEGADDRERFLEGLTSALNEHLSRLTGTRRFQLLTETDRRRRGITDPIAARQQFGANIALRGSLRYSGEDVEVSTALLDTGSGQTIRDDVFTAGGSDSVGIQRRVLDAVLGMMDIQLNAEERLQVAVQSIQPSAHGLYLEGRGYLLNWDRDNNLDTALTLFQSALDIDSRYALALAGRGEAYWRKYELTRSAAWVGPAKAHCEGALAIDDTLAQPHICLAMVLNGTGEFERAVALYTSALNIEPTNDLAYIGLANAYESQQRHADAERTYVRAIEERPHYWGGYNNLGAYYYKNSRFSEALQMFQNAVKYAPNSFRSLNNLGTTQFAMEQTADAEATFKKSLAIAANATASSNLGTLYYFDKKYKLAADHFETALKIETTGRYEAWGNLAHLREYLGEKPAAETAYRTARQLVTESISVNRRNPAAHVELADYNAALGEPDAAQRAFREALRLKPDDANTLFRIAVYCETRLKDRAEALRWLRLAVERGKTWPEIDGALELRQLRTDPRFTQLRTSR